MKNYAYPNFAPESALTKPIYNLSKWLEGMREIYTKLHFGDTYKNAFATITSNWDEVEKRDFETWMQYYQSNNHNKYKKANFYINDNIPGYFIPNTPKSLPSVVPDISEPIETVNKDIQDITDKNQRRKVMEDQRKKIIGRLNAAIKHLTSHEGHMLAGEEFEKLLSSMYEILKQVQTVNKVSLSNQLYKDLIIRQANKLNAAGHIRSSAFLQKFAQNTPSKFDAHEGPLPIASKLGDGVSGSLENQTPSANDIAAPVPAALKETENTKDLLDELAENLETGGLTDANFSEDSEDLNEITLDEQLAVEAQIAPNLPTSEVPVAPNSTIKAPSNKAPEISTKPISSDLEVSLPEEENVKVEPDKDVDAIIDSALAGITINDVIEKMEEVIAVFRNRQLSRELMIIDMMLYKLGLISLFPELSEISQKNFEASSYSLSRLEKMISQLNGAVAKPNIDLTPAPTVNNEENARIKSNIEAEQNQNKIDKERRKQLERNEINEMSNKKPEVNNITEEINEQPIQIV